jgi:hypothetical protein
MIAQEASPDAATVAYFRKQIDDARQGLQQSYEEVEA